MTLPLFDAPVIDGRSLTALVARHFAERPGEWVDMHTLARLAGTGGWRTRTSECRRPPYSMTIENRQRRVKLADGRTITVSEYRFLAKDSR